MLFINNTNHQVQLNLRSTCFIAFQKTSKITLLNPVKKLTANPKSQKLTRILTHRICVMPLHQLKTQLNKMFLERAA